MSGKIEGFAHDGQLSAQTAESPVLQKPLSLQRLALRLAVALAIGFNVSGFGGVYDSAKALAKYFHGVESLSAPKTPSDIAVYICSGILLATGLYILINGMTSTAHPGKSPIQKSKPLRYASITLCALWMEQDGIREAVTSVMSCAYGEGVTLPGALFAVCARFATAFQMGFIWYKLISKAFEPSKQKVVPKQMHKDSKQSEILSV
jgi:hypothetical protein